jgi:hypothetical protein
MKKILLMAGILIAIGAGKATAGDGDLFSYDAVTVENQMAQLDQLEAFLLDNPGMTLSQMTSTSNPLVLTVGESYGINGLTLLDDKTLGIPGFIWGCCLNWVGILVVYLVGKDPVQTKQAILGCVVGSLLGIGTSVAAQLTGALSGFLGGGTF